MTDTNNKKKEDIQKKDILYHNDYSPRYRPFYNIYDKARNHMRDLKGENKKEADFHER